MKFKFIISLISLGLIALMITKALSQHNNQEFPPPTSSSVITNQNESGNKNEILKTSENPTKNPSSHHDHPMTHEDSHLPLAELAGPVNNQYGIRDDILEYIDKTISSENKMARKAVLTYAALSQFIYYSATEEQAVKAMDKKMFALACISSLQENDWINITRKISQLMFNTTERDKHRWHIDEKYFSWKVFGFGNFSNSEIDEICKAGNY